MTTPSEQDLHAYVDGRLDPEHRSAVEKSLAEHPERATEVRAWQRDAQQLRAALGGLDDVADNPQLDPARIRARLRSRRRSRPALAVGLALSVALGAIGGWYTHAWRNDGTWPPMSDAMHAYRMFASEDALHPDFTPRDAGDMQAWLDHQFASAPRLPDLAPAGFHPVGARLLPQLDGPAAMVLYRDAQGDVISFFMRQRVPLPRGERSERDLVANYGSGDHYSVALVSHAGRDAAIARRALADSF